MKLQGRITYLEAAAFCTAAAITGTIAAKLILAYKSNRIPIKKPQKWMKVGQVTQLTIYPIKSCAGVSVKEGIVTKLGLVDSKNQLLRDRVFMVVNDKGLFQLQKEFPRMALIEFQCNEDEVTLTGPGLEDCIFKIPTITPDRDVKCQIFLEDNLHALDCGEEPAAWICQFLGSQGLRLVFHYQNVSQRALSVFQKQFPLTTESDVAAFQNYTSYLLIGQESVDQLNTHLKTPVTFKNFRPTILVSGLQEPFAEIRWGYVRIGKAFFKASKPCERCSITTVNQETGERDPTGDPLKTLIKIRPNFEDAVVKELLKSRGIMGLQMGLYDISSVIGDEHGGSELQTISVGDYVYVALL